MAEYLDIVTEWGEPTGQTVERSAAHRQGVRHRTAHVWILRRGPATGRLEILLQKRSPNKDSHPGCWDISSAGHIPAGVDYIPSALRELEEELGVRGVAPAELRYCGLRRFRFEGTFHGEPFVDEQVTRVYRLWLNREPAAFALQAEEVSEVRWFDFDACLQAVRQNTIPHCIYPEELELVRQGAQEDDRWI